MVSPVTGSLGGLFYEVVVTNPTTGFRWEGQVDSGNLVAELVGPGSRRITAANAEATDVTALVKGNHAFALNLYQMLRTEPGNLCYSPLSISQAVAMAYAGARGETELQMAKTLHYRLPQDELPPAFNALDLELARRGDGAKARDGKGFRLNTLNALWAQRGFFLLPEFLDVLAEDYGAPLRLGDFVNAPEESRRTINNWVREHTEGRIEDLIEPGAVSSLTRLVIVNTIYFDAAWHQPFKAESTRGGTFHLLNADTITVPMMNKQDWRYYADGNRYQVVELPYVGKELSMVILVPEIATFRAFEASLDAERLDAILAELEWGLVSLTMPKFEFASDFKLKEPLSRMGMPAAFSLAEADFSGMTGHRELFIQDVVHQAFVSVDEAGTEVAAATGLPMPPGMPKEGPIEIRADRPFLFLIRDRETGAILFLGRVINPG
jgi:serpin B